MVDVIWMDHIMDLTSSNIIIKYDIDIVWMLDDVMVLEPSIIHHFMVEFRSGILKTWYRKSWSISPSKDILKDVIYIPIISQLQYPSYSIPVTVSQLQYPS